MRGSANFNRDAWNRVRAHLVEHLEDLTLADADGLLRLARVDRPKTLNQVDSYLAAHGDGVLYLDASCPRGLIRLTHVLVANGHTSVRPPACTNCQRRAPLTSIGPTGRICGHCRDLNRPFMCARCAKTSIRRVNLPEGPVCSNCYSRDPLSRKQCSICGRLGRRARRLADGGVLCPACAPPRINTCAQCGRRRPTPYMTSDGRICKSCYDRATRVWVCGLCGVTRRRQSGSVLGPHLCGSCRGITTATYSGIRSPHAQSVCAFCRRLRPVAHHWPAGPVCTPCSRKAKMYPAQCGGCGKQAVLIGFDPHGRRLCGPCSDCKLDYRCATCGEAGVRAHNRCSRCCTAALLKNALAGHDGEIPTQLRPIANALASANDPRSVAVWLGKSAAAELLSNLAHTGTDISHAALDQLPPGRHVNYVREILVRTKILPPRNEYLERIAPWLDRHLTNYPTEHAQLVRSYAVWYLLHRARRAKRPLSNAGAARIRYQVCVALEFLAWLEARDRVLTTMNQADIDTWLAHGTWRHREIRPFLRWTAQRRITHAAFAPANRPSPPSVFIDEATHLDQLHRCLNDDTLDIDLRAGGALILLYGITTARVLGLRQNQIHTAEDNTYLTLRDHDMMLPPKLAQLLAQLPRSNRRSTLPEPLAPDRLLFPGRTPDRPVNAGGFGKRLKREDLTIRGGRNTGLMGLAAELPAAVLADLLAIDIGTATRWAGYAKRNWNDYLAIRHADAQL